MTLKNKCMSLMNKISTKYTAFCISLVMTTQAKADTFSDMIDTGSEQVKSLGNALPILFWVLGLVFGAAAIMRAVKKNNEGAQSQIGWGSVVVLLMCAAGFVSVGFLVGTAAESVGAQSEMGY